LAAIGAGKKGEKKKRRGRPPVRAADDRGGANFDRSGKRSPFLIHLAFTRGGRGRREEGGSSFQWGPVLIEKKNEERESR